MENASAIFYGHEVFRERNVSVGLIAHETAHQWFGDAVTPRDWGELWLSEGFATYFEKLWVQHSRGTDAFLEEMRKMRSDVLDAAESRERPVIDSLQTDLVALLNVNSYQKGAWTLHMLRSLIGDSAFFTGIRSYYKQYKHSTATTDDLCHEMERASGRELRWFFDQWLRRPGYAIISARWGYDETTKSVHLEIAQGSRFAPYRFPLEVEVVLTDGTSRHARVDVEARSRLRLTLPILVPSNPKNVYLDPDVELLASIKVESLK
jgi:aminopeptidase N